MSNSFFDLYFGIIKTTANSRYADGNVIILVTLGPIALFSKYKLTTSSGEHFEEISHAHIISSMYELTISSRDSDDLSIGFDRDRRTRQPKYTVTKNMKGKIHVSVMLKEIFVFAEHEETATYSLGFKLKVSVNKGDVISNKAVAIADARFKFDKNQKYVPHYRPSNPQQGILSKQILSKTTRELRYIK